MNELEAVIKKAKSYFPECIDNESYIWSIIQQDNAYYVPKSFLALVINKEYGEILRKLSKETNSWIYKNEIISLDEWLKIYNPNPPKSELSYSPCIWDDVVTKHPAHIIKYQGTIENLVDDISNLRYDVLEDFFTLLSNKISQNAKSNENHERKQLTKKLNELANLLKQSKEKTKQIWELCYKRINHDY